MVLLRPATDDDSAGVIALIARVFVEYPGCILDVEREEPGLRAPASSYDRFWVAELDGAVVGCIACSLGDGVAELKKLYVDRAARRQGLGRRLIALVEEAARDHRAARIHLWTDTRFEAAHAVFERLGYHRLPETRDLHDLSGTTEYHYEKEVPAHAGRETRDASE
jgi:putative acetyltransferase